MSKTSRRHPYPRQHRTGPTVRDCQPVRAPALLPQRTAPPASTQEAGRAPRFRNFAANSAGHPLPDQIPLLPPMAIIIRSADRRSPGISPNQVVAPSSRLRDAFRPDALSDRHRPRRVNAAANGGARRFAIAELVAARSTRIGVILTTPAPPPGRECSDHFLPPAVLCRGRDRRLLIAAGAACAEAAAISRCAKAQRAARESASRASSPAGLPRGIRATSW